MSGMPKIGHRSLSLCFFAAVMEGEQRYSVKCCHRYGQVPAVRLLLLHAGDAGLSAHPERMVEKHLKTLTVSDATLAGFRVSVRGKLCFDALKTYGYLMIARDCGYICM